MRREWVAWGNDDAPAINAAMSSGATAVLLPATATSGIFSPINLPTTRRIDFQCNGATIAALAPMAEMLNEAQPVKPFATEGSTVEALPPGRHGRRLPERQPQRLHLGISR